jgi:hypothetical protein
LAKKGIFENVPFQDIPFVVPFSQSSSDPLSPKDRDGWPDSIAPRNKRYEVNLMSAAFELVSKGYCAIFSPLYKARQYGLTVLDPPRGISGLDREVWMVKRTEAVESREFKRIAVMIRKLCNRDD